MIFSQVITTTVLYCTIRTSVVVHYCELNQLPFPAVEEDGAFFAPGPPLHPVVDLSRASPAVRVTP